MEQFECITVKLDSIAKNKISIKNVKEASESDNINIKLQYPQIEGADYVSLINDNVRHEINERSLSESSITPFETISNDEDYYLSGDAVVVYFQQYEYFPYAAGIQEFPIDFSDLQDILSPNFDFLQ